MPQQTQSQLEQMEFLSYLDGIIACLEQYPSINLSVPFMGGGVDVNVFDFLLMLLEKFYTKEELSKFLAYTIVYILPILEVTIKGLILANLKTEISCNIDPWVPDEWRQHMDNPSRDAPSPEGDPCCIPLTTIDWRGILNVSPLSQEGKKYYSNTNVLYRYNERYVPADEKNPYLMTADDDVLQQLDAMANNVPELGNAALKNNSTSGYEHKVVARFIQDSDYSTVYTQAKQIFGDAFDVRKIISAGDINWVYQLARSKDMNAFMWLVAHKGVFSNVKSTDVSLSENNLPYYASTISTLPNKFEFNVDNEEYIEKKNDYEIYLSGDIVRTNYNGINGGSGAVFSTNYLLCHNGKLDYDDEADRRVYNAELYPCSDRENSFNWYTPKANTMFGAFGNKVDPLESFEKKSNSLNLEETFYDSENSGNFQFNQAKPLFNLSFIDAYNKPTTTVGPGSYFRFKVLPRPLLHYEYELWLLQKDGLTLPFPCKRIRFNELGQPDPKGRFTVLSKRSQKDERYLEKPQWINPEGINDKGEFVPDEEHLKRYTGAVYQLMHVAPDAAVSTSKPYYLIVEKGEYRVALNVVISGEKIVSAQPLSDEDQLEFINSYLIPCYPALTIFEFNYDFIMTTPLFDPKVIAMRILSTLFGFNVSLGLTMDETMYQKRITDIIKNVINAPDQQISDCFFSFDNSKMAEMLKDAEMRRAEQYPFEDDSRGGIKINTDEILNTLNEFSSTATKEEQIETIQRTFEQAMASITNEVLPEDKLNLNKNIIIESIKLLAFAIFETLISPKLLLLFEANRRMMSTFQDKGVITIEDLLKNYTILLTSIVREIVKTIAEQMMTLIRKKLKELAEKLATMLTIEQVTFYRELIKKMIEACTFNFPWFGHRTNLDSDLDVVRYADIDPIEEQPEIDNC